MSVPNAQNIIGVGNYVYSLLGAKLQLANQILANGSGGVVPSPSGNTFISPYSIDITISAGQSGVSTYQSDDLIGISNLVELVVNNQPFQLTSGFTYNSAQGLITFVSYTLQTSDQITGNAYKTVTS